MKKAILSLLLVVGLLFLTGASTDLDVANEVYDSVRMLRRWDASGMVDGYCSATYIGSDYWLTAKHCLKHGDAYDIDGLTAVPVRYGSGSHQVNWEVDWALLETDKVGKAYDAVELDYDHEYEEEWLYRVGFDRSAKTFQRVYYRSEIKKHPGTHQFLGPGEAGRSGGGVFNDEGELIAIIVRGNREENMIAVDLKERMKPVSF